MASYRSWAIIGANIAIFAMMASACRNEPPTANNNPIPTLRPTEQSSTAITADPITVEVTRLIIETEIIEVSPKPEDETPGPKELVICLGQEPASLYPYSEHRRDMATIHVLHGIYEDLITTLSYDYQARGIKRLPNLSNGDAVIRAVEVGKGALVFDVNQNVVGLAEGVVVRTIGGEEVVFDGRPLIVPQMTVDFELKPLVWSDGTPVTAEDSVYSFKLASDPATPVPKTRIERTASYEATGELTLRWTAVPGYLDPTYFTNVWMPLPRHYWKAYSAAELLESPVSNRTPLSNGPYVIDEWVDSDHLTLVKNNHYYLASEGLPRIERIRFNFVPTSSQVLAQLLSGQCDIGTHEAVSVQEVPLLLDAEQRGILLPYIQAGTVFEHIDFGIKPASTYVTTRPNWFKDSQVRQAFVMCIDRQGMVDEFLYGQSEVMNAYVPDVHPLYPKDATTLPYDPPRANVLLDEAGYLDKDGDGIREDPRLGVPFKITLFAVLGSDMAEHVANRVKENLAACGVRVELQFLDSDIYFADGPEGPLFGRRFDLAAFPWLISIEPNCSLYLSTRIPGPENNWNRNFNNETGFENPEFDAQCDIALATVPGQPEYEAAHKNALRIWTEQVPIIPLFMRLKMAAARPEIDNFRIDSTQPSELWNLYEIDIN